MMRYFFWGLVSLFGAAPFGIAQEPSAWDLEALEAVLAEIDAEDPAVWEALSAAVPAGLEPVRELLDLTPVGGYLKPLPDELYLELARGEAGEEALRRVRRWQSQRPPPEVDAEGRARYELDAGTPIVVVKPLQLTQIRLQAGETIRDIFLGDSHRWSVENSRAGSGPNATPLLAVKVAENNLTSGLLITTDRRTYCLQLVSSSVHHLAAVGFRYPEAEAAAGRTEPGEPLPESSPRLEALASRLQRLEGQWQAQVRREGDRGTTALPPDRLDFGYRIQGSSRIPWRPLHVFNDGSRTYIVMPARMQVEQAPVVMLLDRKRLELVNYRLLGDRFVVDRLFDEAVLISGVGRRQWRITISRR